MWVSGRYAVRKSDWSACQFTATALFEDEMANTPEVITESGRPSPFRNRAAGSLAGCVIAALWLAATPVAATSLNEALRQAYRYNPELEAERARLRAVDESVAIARSGYRPTIEGEYTAAVTETNQDLRPGAGGGLAGTDGADRFQPRTFSLTLAQPLFTGFQVTNAVNEAEANVRAGQQLLRNTEQTVLLDAATAYTDVVRDIAIVRLTESNLEFLSQQLRATQDRFQVGEVTRTDVAQAQARQAQARSDLDLATANLKSSRARYVRIVGSEATGLSVPPLPQRFLPKTLNEAIDIALRQNPTIIAALYSEQAARFTVSRLTGQLLPQVDLNASYSVTEGASDTISRSETGTLIGRLRLPLYQGGQRYAEIRQAKHTHVSQLQVVEQRRTEAKELTVSAWSRLESALAQLKSDRAQVEANQIALQGVQEEERVGQRTLLDVLDAQQELLISQVDLTRTRRDSIVAAYTLLAAIGRLDTVQLGLSETVYDPDVHYHEVRRKWFGLSITHRDGRQERVDAWDEKKGSAK